MNYVLNRQGAVAYAEKWWNSFNPDYVNYEDPSVSDYKVDCTNFVSQCWHEGGGISMMPLHWTGGPTTKVTTAAWANVEAFADYMTKYSVGIGGLPIADMKWSSNDATIGDIIQFYSEEHGGWYHSAIISRIDPVYGICYAAHSDAHLQKPLSDVYPNGGVTEVRFICPRYAE